MPTWNIRFIPREQDQETRKSRSRHLSAANLALERTQEPVTTKSSGGPA